jgi:hypothetical protein
VSARQEATPFKYHVFAPGGTAYPRSGAARGYQRELRPVGRRALRIGVPPEGPGPHGPGMIEYYELNSGVCRELQSRPPYRTAGTRSLQASGIVTISLAPTTASGGPGSSRAGDDRILRIEPRPLSQIAVTAAIPDRGYAVPPSVRHRHNFVRTNNRPRRARVLTGRV